ncbi:MAG: hypothetical protein ABW000_17860 [Actinoplanes sp.]
MELATVTGDVDLSTPTGRLVARRLGAAARHEAEHKALRQRRQRRQSAEAGKVAGGGHRPFGYEADSVTIREEGAEIIRECVRRVLAMESLAARGWQAGPGRACPGMCALALLATTRAVRPRRIPCEPTAVFGTWRLWRWTARLHGAVALRTGHRLRSVGRSEGRRTRARRASSNGG